MGSSTEKRFADSLVKKFAEHLLALGLLSDEDIRDTKRLAKIIIKYAQKADFVPVIDHTESLLRAAGSFAQSRENEMAIMLYATYFEHAFNNLLDYHLSATGVKARARTELIRAVNMNGKCGWMLEVLGLPDFSKKHAAVVLEVAAERNAFVHYKWNPKPDTAAEKQVDLIKKAKAAAVYMKAYTSRVLFGSKRGRLHKALTTP